MKKIYLILVLILVLSSTAVMGALTDGLIAYYKLDNATTSGSTTYDSLSRFNATLVNSPIVNQSGKIIDAFNFTTGTDYVVTGANVSGMNSASWCYWFMPITTSANQNIIHYHQGSGQDAYIMDFQADNTPLVRLVIGGAEVDCDSTSTLSAYTWYHGCTVYNGTNLALYLNGGLNKSVSASGTVTNSVVTYFGQYYSASAQYGGKLDEVGIWNRTLTTTEIAQLYNSGSGLTYPFSTVTNFSITATNNPYSETIYTFNATISGTTYSTTNGTIVTPYLTNHTSLLNITINAPSHDERNYTNQNISSNLAAVLNFSYYRLNVTAQTYIGANITNFTLSVNSTNYTTTTGSIVLNLTKSATYNVSIDAPGYALDSALINMTTWMVNHTFILYPDNSLLIYIFDESTIALINTLNVTITFSTNSTSWTNITDTGSITLQNLTAAEHTIIFSLTGYSSRTYIVTVGDRTTQILNAYLLNSTDDTIFTVKDQDTSEVLSDVMMTMYRQINGSWTTIESKYTDITGKAQFYYETGGNYKFYLSKSSYDDYVFFLNPILFSTYDVYMSKSVLINYSQDYDQLSIIYSPAYFQNGVTSNFSFIISSPTGLLISYGVNLTYPGGSNATAGYNAIGSQLNLGASVSGADSFDVVELNYYYVTTLSGRRNFTVLLPIIISPTAINGTFMSMADRTFGLGIFERLLIATIIILFVVGIATMVGQPIPGMALGLFVFGFMSYIGFVPLWAILPSMFIGVIFLVWKSGGS